MVDNTDKSQQVFAKEDKYGAHNYHPIPVALTRGEGNKINRTSKLSSVLYKTCRTSLIGFFLLLD